MAIHAAPLAAQLPGSLGDRVLGLHRTFTGGVEGSHEAEGEAVRTTVASMPRDDQVHAAVHLADLADDLAFEIRATHATLDPTD